jgi:hypothetical protein
LEGQRRGVGKDRDGSCFADARDAHQDRQALGKSSVGGDELAAQLVDSRDRAV